MTGGDCGNKRESNAFPSKKVLGTRTSTRFNVNCKVRHSGGPLAGGNTVPYLKQ